MVSSLNKTRPGGFPRAVFIYGVFPLFELEQTFAFTGAAIASLLHKHKAMAPAIAVDILTNDVAL